MNKGQVVYIQVTGNNASDYGPFKLSVELEKEGSSLATAIYLGADAKEEVSGSTVGYSDTYINTRCNGNVTADGPDVVRVAAWPGLAWFVVHCRCTLPQYSLDRSACSAVLRCSAVCMHMCALLLLGAAQGELPATHLAACPPAPLQFYSYSAPIAGMVKVKACGTGSFDAKVVIMKDSGVAGVPNVVVACGSCSEPAV